MDKKIFFLDLDGTVLQDDKTISKENYDAIQWALKKGHCIAVTTGRPVVSAQRIIDMLGLNREGGYLIAYNGGSIYDCNTKQLLHDERVDLNDVKYLHDEAKKAGIFFQTYTQTHVVTERSCPEADFYFQRIKMDYIYDEDIWKHVVESPNKAHMISLDDHDKLERFKANHMEWQQGKCDSLFSCPQFLEYVPLHASKGNAIHKMSELLHIPMEQTVAIGDERNDISMIIEAGCGVCMINGHEDVKAIADVITERDNNHGGVAEMIYRLG